MSTSTTYLETKKHYPILDGLRGVAALMVISMHTLEVFDGGSRFVMLINHGYLAVDFFFLLSGFVVAYAYDDRWGKMTQWEFYKRRLVRLQPMVVIGSIVGAILFYFQEGSMFPLIAATPVWKLLLIMVIGATLIPIPVSWDIRAWAEMHPLNGPAWSLFFEYVANILYATILRRLSNRALSILVALAACLTTAYLLFGSEGDLIGGWSVNTQQLSIGSIRVLYPFCAGLLLCRMSKLIRIRNAFGWCSLLLILLLSIPRIGGEQHIWMNGLYEALVVIIIFPLIVSMGAGGSIGNPRSARLCKFLGDISYPLYITHYPFIYTYDAWITNNKIPLGPKAILVGLAMIALCIALAYTYLKRYDEPVREWLRKKFLVRKKIIASAFLLILIHPLHAQQQKPKSRDHYDIAAFLYPAYAANDPRLRPFWPAGIGEWETVTNMQDRNPGHYWNRKPLWGTVNEADPAVMSMEINQALKHGVNVFIFDWYWYDNRPFMETTLDSGFLKADNARQMKFYLMWANHDVNNYWDTRLFKYHDDNIIWQGSVDRTEFEKICKRNIEKYFKQPQYYKIEGKPVFMIYDLPNLVKGLGGIQQTIDGLKWFVQETKKAGFPGLDLQFTMWASNFNFSGFDADKDQTLKNQVIKQLGFTSATHYQFAHFINVDDDYLNILEGVKKEWTKIDTSFDLPYYPHISIGWDNSPRTTKSAVVRNNTPQNFEKGLRMAKAYIDAHPKQTPLITINSWNEWTETSYLQPDNLFGYGYLDAVKNVFLLNQ